VITIGWVFRIHIRVSFGIMLAIQKIIVKAQKCFGYTQKCIRLLGLFVEYVGRTILQNEMGASQ